MPTNIKIIRARDFVRATPEGQFDLRKSKEVLVEVASTSANLANVEVVLDTRLAQTNLSVADVWYLAAELSRLRDAYRGKTAVLCPTEHFDKAEFFALC